MVLDSNSGSFNDNIIDENPNNDEKFNQRTSYNFSYCNESELVDVIDEISICSFISYDSLKEYAKYNRIFETESLE